LNWLRVRLDGGIYGDDEYFGFITVSFFENLILEEHPVLGT